MATASAPNLRIEHDSLTDQIQNNREDMRERRCFPIGKMLAVMLAPSDEARYAQSRSVRDRIAAVSQKRGLQLEWSQDVAPHISWNRKKNGIVFPYGCPKPPRIKDNRFAAGGVNQNIFDYADGYILGRDNTEFVVLQPVIYIGVWILAGLYTYVAHADPITGKYPALLLRENSSEAHIVHGELELTSASAPPQTYKPWEQSGNAGS
jgi:hypothetical protein